MKVTTTVKKLVTIKELSVGEKLIDLATGEQIDFNSLLLEQFGDDGIVKVAITQLDKEEEM